MEPGRPDLHFPVLRTGADHHLQHHQGYPSSPHGGITQGRRLPGRGEYILIVAGSAENPQSKNVGIVVRQNRTISSSGYT
ncbi:hypothetical protein evm_014916 [Chilo suppressalis]|nr:hypothetical protein evm_014916 [Chilo suppressalis]